MQVVLSAVAVENETSRSNDHGWKHDTKTVLCLTNSSSLAGEARSETIRTAGERNGERVSNDVAESNQTGVDRVPVVWRLNDLERESVVEGEGTETDVDTERSNDPEYGRDEEVGEGAEHSHEELGLVVDSAPRLESLHVGVTSGNKSLHRGVVRLLLESYSRVGWRGDDLALVCSLLTD